MSDAQSEFVQRHAERGMAADSGPGMPAGARQAVVFLFVLALAIGTANLLWTSREVSGLRSSVTAQCQFDADLSGVPVTVNPATGKASLLGVQIVSDSRVAWRGLGCPGRLPPPAKSFIRWARFYHLPDQ